MTDAASLLNDTLQILADAQVPDDLRKPAFLRVFDFLAAAAEAKSNGETPGAIPSRITSKVTVAPTAESDHVFARIGRELGVTTEVARRMYTTHGDSFYFEGPLDRLGASKAEKVAGLALLIIAGRTSAGIDASGTLDLVVRQEVDRHGLLDVSNYTKHIARLRPFISTFGTGRDSVYRLKYDAKSEVSRLIELMFNGEAKA